MARIREWYRYSRAKPLSSQGAQVTENRERPTGLTQDVGFEIGVRRTLPIGVDEAWELITAPEGVSVWLGPTAGLSFDKGATFSLADGSSGEVRVVNPGAYLRITWQPGTWHRASTIQVRVIPNGDRSVIAFHQEHLPGANEREERRAHFKSALDHLERMVG